MNFTAQSIKPDLKSRNDDFFLEIRAPRGQLFAVLDFAPHDLANLNTALEGKIETIVESFDSLSQFSAELFVGFLVKEINNFLHQLTSNPEAGDLTCSGAFCLVQGNQLSYFVCGDVDLLLLNEGQIFSLSGDSEAESASLDQQIARLGEQSYDRQLPNLVTALTLKNEDVVLIMTMGVSNEFESEEFVDLMSDLNASDGKSIAKALMEASEGSHDDRTLVIIGGPYDRIDEPAQNLIIAPLPLGEQRAEQLTASVASVSANHVGTRGYDGDLDLKLEQLSKVLSSKADASQLARLEHEVLRLARGKSAGSNHDAGDPPSAAEFPHLQVRQTSFWQKPVALAALMLLVGVAGGFLGSWMQSMRSNAPTEAWAVSGSGNQILISRLNSNGTRSTVTLNSSSPVRTSGEQSFSSFADVKQYVDTVMPDTPVVVESVSQPAEPAATSAAPPVPSEPVKKKEVGAATTTISFKQGDSLKKLAQRYKVAPAKLIALNPNISRWSLIKVGQRVVVSETQQTARTRSQPQANVRRLTGANAAKVQIEIGDNLNRLASRHNVSPSRLKELNPQITNWSRIQAGQKILVRMPSRG